MATRQRIFLRLSAKQRRSEPARHISSVIERQQSYFPSGRHCDFRSPTNATIGLKGSLETATLEKIVKKSCGYWTSPDVEAGKVTAGSMVVMILDECAEGQDVYDEYEDGYMDVGAGFLLPPLRRVLQYQSASSQRMGNRSGSGHKRWSRRMHNVLTVLWKI